MTLEPRVLTRGDPSIGNLPLDMDSSPRTTIKFLIFLWTHYVVENMPIKHSSKQHACEKIFEQVGGDVLLNEVYST